MAKTKQTKMMKKSTTTASNAAKNEFAKEMNAMKKSTKQAATKQNTNNTTV